MNARSVPEGKAALAVDDEPDVLLTVGEIPDMRRVDKAGDFETGLQLIMRNRYDVVILDIMGVSGFELPKNSALRGFPSIGVEGHADGEGGTLFR